MRWSVGNSEWHGWHTDAYPLNYDLPLYRGSGSQQTFLNSFRIADNTPGAWSGASRISSFPISERRDRVTKEQEIFLLFRSYSSTGGPIQLLTIRSLRTVTRSATAAMQAGRSAIAAEPWRFLCLRLLRQPWRCRCSHR